ncbi:MAG: PIN domain-containing protein [Candidatus Micrarchaeota archaeon]
MALKIVADSWAIIEYLQDGSKADEIEKRLMAGTEILFTSLLLAEVHYRIRASSSEDAAKEAQRFIFERTKFIGVSPEIAIDAANIHLEEKLPLVDAFTLAIARKEDAKVLTGDPHFRKVKEAIYVGD